MSNGVIFVAIRSQGKLHAPSPSRCLRVIRREKACCALFGATTEYWSAFMQRAQGVARLLCEEQGVPLEEGKRLSPETELGTRSEEAFNALREWVKENDTPADPDPDPIP